MKMNKVRKYSMQLVRCKTCGKKSGLDYGDYKCPYCGSEDLEVIKSGVNE